MREKLYIIFFMLIIFCNVAFSQEPQQKPVQQTLPYTESNECFQVFQISGEKLFYLALAGINENNFKAKEALTREGYILFSAGNKDFLALISSINNSSSIIKITPADNSYYFPKSIINNIFSYITLNQALDPKVLIKGK